MQLGPKDFFCFLDKKTCIIIALSTDNLLHPEIHKANSARDANFHFYYNSSLCSGESFLSHFIKCKRERTLMLELGAYNSFKY